MIPKFRAWHKEERKMYEVVRLFFDKNYADLYDHANAYTRGSYFHEMELFQCAGLLDEDSGMVRRARGK